jgi:hypothetical protein
MKTGKRFTIACCSLVALMLLVASSPLGGRARSAAFVGIRPDSPALKHYAVAGTGLGTSADQAQASSNGCMSLDPRVFIQADRFGAVVLPEGSIIKYVTMWYYSHSSAPVHGWVEVNQLLPGEDPSGEIIVSLVGGGDGFNSVTSGELTHVVDMTSNFYQLRSYLTSGGLPEAWPMLCGFRIDYIPPSIFAVALPHIAR